MSDKPITSSHPNLREVSLVPPPLLQTSGRAQRAPRHPQLGEQASGEENTPLPLSFLLFSNKKTSNQALKKKKKRTKLPSSPLQTPSLNKPQELTRQPCPTVHPAAFTSLWVEKGKASLLRSVSSTSWRTARLWGNSKGVVVKGGILLTRC